LVRSQAVAQALCFVGGRGAQELLHEGGHCRLPSVGERARHFEVRQIRVLRPWPREHAPLLLERRVGGADGLAQRGLDGQDGPDPAREPEGQLLHRRPERHARHGDGDHLVIDGHREQELRLGLGPRHVMQRRQVQGGLLEDKHRVLAHPRQRLATLTLEGLPAGRWRVRGYFDANDGGARGEGERAFEQSFVLSSADATWTVELAAHSP
jgi:hypothetical protein